MKDRDVIAVVIGTVIFGRFVGRLVRLRGLGGADMLLVIVARRRVRKSFRKSRV
jgi:hypothetical protein